MEDEEYELEVLLELRESEKDEARRAHADEMEELERRKSYAESLRGELRELRDERREWRDEFERRRAEEGLGSGEARQYENYLRGLRADEEDLEREIERAEEAIREQRERVEEAREELNEAAKQLEAVERHREDWEQQRQRRERRREAERMDDIAARIWREENS